MRSRSLWSLVGVAALLGGSLLVAHVKAPEGGHPPRARSGRPALTKPAQDALEVIARHASASSLLVVPADGTTPDAIRFHAAVARPLASERKLVVVDAYAAAVVAHALDPPTRVPIDAVERFSFPLTDSGAHPAALKAIPHPGGQWTLRQLARAPAEFSDNAASDELQTLVGRAMIAATAARAGLPTPPLFSAELQAASRPQTPVQWLSRVGYAGQAAWARTTSPGSANAIAGLLRTARATPAARQAFSWPLRKFAANRAAFAEFLAKGGSFPGVLNQSILVRPRHGAQRAWIAVAFIGGLRAQTYSALSKSGDIDALLVELSESARARRFADPRLQAAQG